MGDVAPPAPAGPAPLGEGLAGGDSEYSEPSGARPADVAPPVVHDYLSTACLHGRHDHCAGPLALDGSAKAPARCKWCPAPCGCRCHRGEEG